MLRARARMERVREQWRAWRTPSVVTLETVRPRLEHFLRAIYDRDFRLEGIGRGLREQRWAHRTLRYLSSERTESGDESAEAHADTRATIRMPRSLAIGRRLPDALVRYRALAVHGAEQFVRGTVTAAPPESEPIALDLYLLAELRAAHLGITRAQPGLAPVLLAARASALASRPSMRWLSAAERRVETIARTILGARDTDVTLPFFEGPEETAAWARAEAARIASDVDVRGYHAIPGVQFWGTRIAWRQPGRAGFKDPRAAMHAAPGRKDPERDRIAAQQVAEPGNDSDSAPQMEDQQSESVSRSTSANEDKTENQGGAPGEPDRDALDERRTASSGVLMTSTRPDATPAWPAGTELHRYPEWDELSGRYSDDGTIVWVPPAVHGSSAWAERALRDHAVLVRQTRQRFEQLQSRREWLRRQPDGDELDLVACVDALVDLAAGRTPDDRLYTAVRPGRREIAIALLIDVSGSTRELVSADARVIDLERLALLVASAALEALGEPYTMLAFASDGVRDVRVSTVRGFDDRDDRALLERVSALEPAGKTRLGAAIRHASSLLARRASPHRLLIVLSDGKPNDRDGYFLDYGIADSRRAIAESRRAGVHAHCITVDADEPGAYLGAIFGDAGYLWVRRPEQLPQALVQSVQRLIG